MSDQTEWVLLDTETDGLYAPIHVIELSAQRMRGLEPCGDQFQIFINHGIEIPEEATSVHGYSTEFIMEYGIDPEIAYAQVREYIGERYVCAHYLRYDWDQVLNPELQRIGLDPIGRRGFCTWMLSKRVIWSPPQMVNVLHANTFRM